MKSNALLRMSFILSETSNSSLRNNIRRLVYSVLYSKNNAEKSIFDIIKILSTEYDLHFSTEEILEAIKNDKNISEISYNNITKFRLIPKKYSALTEQNKLLSIDNIICKFLQEFELNYEATEILELIKQFLYNCFNKNKAAILTLINNDIENHNFINQFEFTDTQKELINKFINWDNKEKNQVVFNTIAYCVDYCILTTKKDENSFKSFFAGKRFFLDTNVILRLIGFNNEERQEVLMNFVKKCKEVGIKLFYTNFTYSEIQDTIIAGVKGIKKCNGDERPLTIKQYERYSPKNLSLIKLYNNWYIKNKNRYNDYNGFVDYLKHEIDKILKDCELINLENKELTDPEQYQKLYSSLKSFKENSPFEVYAKSLCVDINNFISINDKRNKENGTNIYNLNTYLITTDSRFCEWNKKLYPGNIPICVLPSIWYSLILKIYGRTTNDYKAFNNFLTLRYKSNDTDNYAKKEEILRKVQNLPEPQFIKEKILDKIYNRLSNQESIDDPQKLVEEENIKVAEEELLSIWAKEGNPFIEAGQRQAFDKIAEKEAEKKHKRIKLILKIIGCLRTGFGIIFFISLIYICFKGNIKELNQIIKNKLDLSIDQVIAISAVVISILTTTIVTPIIKYLSNIKLENLIKKEQDKIIKKYKS